MVVVDVVRHTHKTITRWRERIKRDHVATTEIQMMRDENDTMKNELNEKEKLLEML